MYWFQYDDGDLFTPLSFAKKNGNAELVKLLETERNKYLREKESERIEFSHEVMTFFRKELRETNVFSKTKNAIKESQHSTKIKYIFFDTLSRRAYFSDTAVPSGSQNSHIVVQSNTDEDENYLLTPYPTLMQPLKKFSPESNRAIARNPIIDLQSIGIYSKSDIQRHIRIQQFQ